MKNKAAVSLGKKGGIASSRKQGKKKLSANGKKGMAVRWGKKDEK